VGGEFDEGESARVTTARAAKASTLPGAATDRGLASVCPTMAARFEDPALTDKAKIARRIVGSARAAMVVSRLDPIPPNAVPVSRPASARPTVPSSSR
jgi:hypothetical protein